MPVLLFAQGNYSILSTYPTMDRFYRNTPLLADNFYNNSASILLEVPAFLIDSSISFRYQKRQGYQYEQLFADNVNIVRFLGGWSALKNNTTIADISQWDLAYRDLNGTIIYRWNLIPARIDPVLQMGYNSPNIVLDNIPWCFPLTPYEPISGGYGQCNPPRDMGEWGKFITDLCTELVQLYGYDRVNTWGFRIGTEAGSLLRFNGTAQQYNDFYKTTALAINSILPLAKVFPYNRAGQGTDNLKTLLSDARVHNYSFTASPLSTYSIAKIDPVTGLLNTSVINPDLQATTTTQMWYDMNTICPFSTLSHEIHEYGWFLTNELGDADNAPGARGAAGNFHYIMNLRQRGLDKLFHWSVTDPSGEWQKVILTGQGFIYSIWDYCIGARTVELNKILKYIPQSTQLYKSVGYLNSTGKSYIMVSGYNMDRTQQNQNEISVYIPKTKFYDPNVKLSFTTLNDSTDQYRMLRDDLASKGVLYPQYAANSNYVPQYNTMSNKGKWWLQADNDKFIARIKENLTLKPFKGKVEITNNGTILTFPIHTPELFVIALEKGNTTDISHITNRKNILSVYPNPANDKIFIETFAPEFAELYSLDGTKVKQIYFNTISAEMDLRDLSKGIYILKIKHNNILSFKRIVKS